MAGRRERRRLRKKRRWAIPALCFLLVSVVLAPQVPARDQAAGAPGKRPAPAQSVYPAVWDGAGPVQEDPTAAPEPSAGEGAPTAAAESDAEEAPAPAEPVGDNYFSDAAFLGDSRTEAFYLYSGLKEGRYYYATGATVKTVQDRATVKTPAGKKTVLDALKDTDCGKVYIMLGVNELGWVYPETFAEEYGKVVDRVRRDHPNAAVGIQSILPVSAGEDKRRGYVNNERIALYNGLLEQLAEDRGCAYVDVAPILMGEDGTLRPELTGDGVHPNAAGCRAWLDYLRNHPL